MVPAGADGPDAACGADGPDEHLVPAGAELALPAIHLPSIKMGLIITHRFPRPFPAIGLILRGLGVVDYGNFPMGSRVGSGFLVNEQRERKE